MLSTLAVLSQAVRSALLAGGLVAVIVAAVDWAVRSRRISPFNGAARFMRARVEPRIAGIERLVLRAGGHQSATPWWAVFAYVLVALAVMAAIDFAIDATLELTAALAAGPLGILALLVHWTFGFFILALLVRVVVSWVPPLRSGRWISWSIGATEWMLRPLRRVLPALGPVDISPIVAYFALVLARSLIESVLHGLS